jgi:hypothetical protein
MERPLWIAPLYGYLVCLIAVVTLLISASNFVDAVFLRADPLSSRDNFGPFGGSLTSLEAYRATMDEARGMRPTRVDGAPVAPGDTLTTEQLRTRYEALRADHIAKNSFQATKDLVKHGLLILLSAVLFFTHWRWVRSQRGANASA